MSTASIQQKIKKLTDEINYHNHLYYLENRSEISDYDFDQKLAQLTDLEKQNPEWQEPDSPTLRVGGAVTKSFETVQHDSPMLSLSNTYSKEDLQEFHERVVKGLGTEAFTYVCELKFDGLAISLKYSNGLLIRAATRGDGVSGDDITLNAKTIRTLPLRIRNDDAPQNLEVRGEVFLPLKEFERLNREIESGNIALTNAGRKKKPLLANPRNTASGTMKMQDSSIVASRNMDCYLYDFTAQETEQESHSEALKLMSKIGFNVSSSFRVCENLDQVFAYIDLWESKRFELPLDTDGIVIKVDAKAHQEELGFTAKSPKWAIAFKYKSQSEQTQLVSITYQVGRTGSITPVANLKPVALAGTTVKRASLHNANEILRLDLHEGDTVAVEKGGEIIPKITGVDASKRKKDAKPIKFIDTCPECQTDLIRKEDEANHYCPNSKGCPPQILGGIEHFISRNALDIDSLGPKTLEGLIHKGLIKRPADLFYLSFEQINGLQFEVEDPSTSEIKTRSLQEKSAAKIIDSIEISKKTVFAKVLFGLGIRYIGKTVAEKLADHFLTIDAMIEASLEELINVPEVGQRIAESLNNYLSVSENIEQINLLKEAGLHLSQDPSEDTQVGTLFEGKIVVVSGVFESYGRNELHDMIKSQGGRIGSSITGKTDILVAGQNMGPAKLEKATKLEILTMSEEELTKMLTNR
jgi:DNA ligase (NAD+)